MADPETSEPHADRGELLTRASLALRVGAAIVVYGGAYAGWYFWRWPGAALGLVAGLAAVTLFVALYSYIDPCG